MAFDRNTIPTNLIDNFRENLGALFIGAGLSVKAGLPTWKGLLEELISEADKISWIPKKKIREYNKLIKDTSKYLFLAEDLKTELGSKFFDYMDSNFSRGNFTPTLDHENLVKIKTNLIITINYDDLIEKAYNKVFNDYPNSFIYSQSREAANNFWKGNFFILKAHGDAKKDVNTLILSQKDYRRVLYREPGYRSLLQSIFTTRSVLFIGVSFSDPEFNQLLDFLHDSYHGGGPTHYLLLDKKNNLDTLAKRYLEEFKIATIPYENADKSYREVSEFIELFKDSI